MLILIAIAILELVLLGATIWSTRRGLTRAHARISRRDDYPHAL